MHDLYNELTFFLKEWILKKLRNLHDENEYVIHVRSLKQALNHKLVLKKVHRIIKFNQKAWLKSHIDMNTELRKNGTNNLEKDFQTNEQCSFCKKLWKNRSIKLVTNEARSNYSASELSYNKTFFKKSY